MAHRSTKLWERRENYSMEISQSYNVWFDDLSHTRRGWPSKLVAEPRKWIAASQSSVMTGTKLQISATISLLWFVAHFLGTEERLFLTRTEEMTKCKPILEADLYKFIRANLKAFGLLHLRQFEWSCWFPTIYQWEEILSYSYITSKYTLNWVDST